MSVTADFSAAVLSDGLTRKIKMAWRSASLQILWDVAAYADQFYRTFLLRHFRGSVLV